MGTSETLRSILDSSRTGKRLDELTTARMIGKVAERLHAAQQLAGPGKAVGPITPNAIAVAADGTVTLELDKKGSVLPYSSPEQASGAAGDRRSDVFSLGCVMWEALTNQRLFDAMNDAAVKAALGEREIKPPSEVNANIPPELSAICMKALSRASADRYTSTKVMGVEISEFLEEAGHEDSNAKLAQYLSQMKPVVKPSTLPPPSLLKKEAEKPTGTDKTEPIKPPGLDKTEPMVPPVAAPKSQQITMPIKPPNAADRAAAAVAVPPTQPTPGLALAAKLSAAETKPVEPAPPILPKDKSAPAADALVAKAVDAPAAPSPLASSLPPIEAVAAFAPAPAEVKTMPLPALSLKSTIAASVPPPPSAPASASATSEGGAVTVVDRPVLPEPSAPVLPANAEGSAPHGANPADVVSLPKPMVHRDSEQVLSRWAWQTDSNEAISDDDEFHPPPSRKPLYYVIGAGCAVALVVVIIAFAGGSSSAKKPPATAAKESAEPAQPAVVPAQVPAKQETAPPEPPKQETPPPEPPKQETPPPEPPKQETPPPEPAKAATPPPEPPKAAVTPPPKAAPPPKAEPPKVAKATPPPPPKAEPPKVAKATPPPKAEPPKSNADVEAAYKAGLMKFARGDTNGALASLRTALAGNPNYAPTWRGLGLVFEKLGEKDQARAAFKRYLQLAPGAGDSEQIKSRMERLGS